MREGGRGRGRERERQFHPVGTGNFVGGIFLSGKGNLRRNDFDHSNLVNIEH